MRAVGVALAVLAAAGCVGDNPRFAGPGFEDPVAGDALHPVWEALPSGSLWSLTTCHGEEGDDDANLGLGTPVDCGGLDVVTLAGAEAVDKQLVSRAIPVVGTVTLSFVTRLEFPTCGDRAWAGGRVVLTADDFDGPVEFGVGELPLADDATPVLGGRREWIEVEHTFEVDRLQDLVVSFGPVLAERRCIAPRAGDPCRLAPDAGPACATAMACCTAALAGSTATGWQLDDIRLSVLAP